MNDRPAYILRKLWAVDLSQEQIDSMWRCYQQFVDCPRSAFDQSLAMAEEVYLCHDSAGGALSGFEAMRTVTIMDGGRKYTVVYTFYADLEQRFRGFNILQRIGLRRYCALRYRHPFRQLYWMFTASTYISYLLLPNNLIEYWPHPDHRTPPQALRIMTSVVDALGLQGWDADGGVLRRNNMLHYREGLVGDHAGLGSNRFIRFYASLNPGQSEGDSLVCLCPLNLCNFLFALYRMISRGRRSNRQVQP
jgi:hypothetical protein